MARKLITKNANGQPSHLRKFLLPKKLVLKNPIAKCVIAINVYVKIGKRPKANKANKVSAKHYNGQTFRAEISIGQIRNGLKQGWPT